MASQLFLHKVELTDVFSIPIHYVMLLVSCYKLWRQIGKTLNIYKNYFVRNLAVNYLLEKMEKMKMF